jgi:branched-chain amino acid transport system substrate-binding protein
MKSWIGVFFVIIAIITVSCNEELKVYRIGAVVPLSGSLEAYGRNMKNGITLALDQVNAAGGIKGKKLDVLFEDDASSEKMAVTRTEELIKTAQVPVIIGGATSNITLAMAQVCENKKVVLLSPAASSPKLSGIGQYIFRNYPSDTKEGKVMAEYVVRRMKVRTIAIVYIENDYGQGLENIFKETFTGLGGAVSIEKPFPPNATNFAAIVKELKSTPTDGIYIIGYYTEIAAFLQEIQKQKVISKIISVEGVAQPMILEIAPEAAEGLIYPQPPYNPDGDDPAIQKFVAAYRAKFPTKPDLDAAFSYDALKVVAKAIENCANYPQDLRARIADTNYRGITGDIGFDAKGDVDITPRIFQIKNGKFEPVHY